MFGQRRHVQSILTSSGNADTFGYTFVGLGLLLVSCYIYVKFEHYKKLWTSIINLFGNF